MAYLWVFYFGFGFASQPSHLDSRRFRSVFRALWQRNVLGDELPTANSNGPLMANCYLFCVFTQNRNKGVKPKAVLGVQSRLDS